MQRRFPMPSATNIRKPFGTTGKSMDAFSLSSSTFDISATGDIALAGAPFAATPVVVDTATAAAAASAFCCPFLKDAARRRLAAPIDSRLHGRLATASSSKVLSWDSSLNRLY